MESNKNKIDQLINSLVDDGFLNKDEINFNKTNGTNWNEISN